MTLEQSLCFVYFFFFSSRRRHTRCSRDWSSDVCSSDLWSLDSHDLASAVLKAPRHGSLSSSTEEFIARVKPKLAIFSVGHRNVLGLPREEVLARYFKAGTQILRTDRDGAIIVATDGKAIRYQTYLSAKRGVVSEPSP